MRAPICVPVSLPSLVVTNFSDFLRISSMAKGSSRRSFLSPTRMMGTPGHRSFASSIHYFQPLVSEMLLSGRRDEPCASRWITNLASPRRIRSGEHALSSMLAAATARNLLGLLYPREPVVPSGRRLGNRSRNFRIPSGPRQQQLEGINAGEFAEDEHNAVKWKSVSDLLIRERLVGGNLLLESNRG